MKLTINHTTAYRYDEPVPYGLQELRLRPRDLPGQRIVSWETELGGCTSQAVFEDEHTNLVELVSLDAGVEEMKITARGVVETVDTAGVVSDHLGLSPLWLFTRSTELTLAGDRVRALLPAVDGREGDIGMLHELSRTILDAVAYESGRTDVDTTAEEALATGRGVCQDHTHIFLAAARALGYPARYVSGHLLLDDDTQDEASHGWAQAWVGGLGWVGFDVSNGISPDERYVQVATGLDYRGAAPISGVRFGSAGETMTVGIEVQQQ